MVSIAELFSISDSRVCGTNKSINSLLNQIGVNKSERKKSPAMNVSSCITVSSMVLSALEDNVYNVYELYVEMGVPVISLTCSISKLASN